MWQLRLQASWEDKMQEEEEEHFAHQLDVMEFGGQSAKNSWRLRFPTVRMTLK